MRKNGDRGAAIMEEESVRVEGFGDHSWYAGVLVMRRRV